jgi:hypothetical protein
MTSLLPGPDLLTAPQRLSAASPLAGSSQPVRGTHFSGRRYKEARSSPGQQKDSAARRTPEPLRCMRDDLSDLLDTNFSSRPRAIRYSQDRTDAATVPQPRRMTGAPVKPSVDSLAAADSREAVQAVRRMLWRGSFRSVSSTASTAERFSCSLIALARVRRTPGAGSRASDRPKVGSRVGSCAQRRAASIRSDLSGCAARSRGSMVSHSWARTRAPPRHDGWPQRHSAGVARGRPPGRPVRPGM